MKKKKKKSWWANALGLDDSEAGRDAQERTDDEYEKRGNDNLGSTPLDSENDDPAHSCGGGDGNYDKD